MKKYISLLGAACLILTSGCSKKQEAEVEAPAPVQVAAVTEDTVRKSVTADGTLFPVDQWNVMPKITAPVQRFLVNRGDSVRKDQLLAVLENKDLIAAAASNKGQVDQAEANLQNTELASIPESIVKAQSDVESDQEQYDAAKKVLESRQKLLQEGALARKLVDDAAVQFAQAKAQLDTAKEHLRTLQTAGKQAQINQAKAQVTAAQGQLRSAEAQVAYTEVRSPGAGIIAERPLYPGDIAATGTPLMVVMDVSRVVARLNVPMVDAIGIKVGQPATLTLVDNGQEVQGKVTVVSPATDPNSSTVQAWVTADNPGRTLKVGAAVHVTIVTEIIKNAMLVPTAAILPGETGGTAVLVIDSDKVAHRRAVQLGVHQGDKVQVLTGVLPREDVVVVGGMGVDDKAKVKVVDATAPEADEEQPEEAAPAKDQKKDEAKPKQK
ncbi:MAG TPA: efflux RND transporter periplasmic adaptor subunit [Candidatus Sulfopaludibacter sp.]|jgi:multidrug efflux pump subunit AcrA (membrane-fusion protein)|nr:efflux RND transporter periplasmic adaptor subunit [Candidatus Sulfopaludibacter sp.]